MHDAKNDLEVASTDSGTSHDRYASHRLNLQSESDEETTTHAIPDGHSKDAPSRIVPSVSPIALQVTSNQYPCRRRHTLPFNESHHFLKINNH